MAKLNKGIGGTVNSKIEIFDCPACGRHYEGLDAFDLRKRQDATGHCCDICEEVAQVTVEDLLNEAEEEEEDESNG